MEEQMPIVVPKNRTEDVGRGELRYRKQRDGWRIGYYESDESIGPVLTFSPSSASGTWKMAENFMETFYGGTSELLSPWHDGSDPMEYEFAAWTRERLQGLRAWALERPARLLQRAADDDERFGRLLEFLDGSVVPQTVALDGRLPAHPSAHAAALNLLVEASGERGELPAELRQLLDVGDGFACTLRSEPNVRHFVLYPVEAWSVLKTRIFEHYGSSKANFVIVGQADRAAEPEFVALNLSDPSGSDTYTAGLLCADTDGDEPYFSSRQSSLITLLVDKVLAGA